MNDPLVHHLALIPWATPDHPAGIPEHFVPAPQSSIQSELPASLQRAWVGLRALPGGDAQILADSPGGVTALRLFSPKQPVVIESPGQVLDAILDPNGGIVVLECHAGSHLIRSLRPDGATAWEIPNLPHLGEDSEPRLLTNATGHLFAAAPGILLRIDQGHPAEIVRWQPGGEPFMCPDGTLGYVVYNAARNARDWVLLDPRQNTHSVIPGTESGWGILSHAVGVDALGRAYGYAAGVLGRIALDGHMNWHVTLQGVAIDPQHNVSLLLNDRGALRIVQRQKSIPLDSVDLPPYARLLRQHSDGTFLLYARTTRTGYGILFLFDIQGRSIGQEPATAGLWQTADDLRPPSSSSITPTGNILLSVLSPSGIHILQLTPP